MTSLTAQALITQAYTLAGIVARELETVSGNQIDDGLTLLNDLLAEHSATGRFIPSYQHQSIVAIPKQQEYEFEGLMHLESMTFQVGAVRFSMKRVSRESFWASPNIKNVVIFPFQYAAERVPGGMRIFFKQPPAPEIDTYTVNGQWALPSECLDFDLSNQLDRYYLSYLKYALAERLCDVYHLPFPPPAQATLNQLRDLCIDINPRDMSAKTLSLFPTHTAANWADANLGRGWRP